MGPEDATQTAGVQLAAENAGVRSRVGDNSPTCPGMGQTGAIVIRPGEGETISDRAERNVVVLTEREDITITWSRYGAGEEGPGPHIHREHADSFYVLEGELTFDVGRELEAVRAPAGTFVCVPPHVVHGFGNRSGEDARWLNFHTPDGGFAEFMRGARDGRDVTFDSFDAPADGGPPASEVIVSGPGEGEQTSTGPRRVWIKGSRAEICFVEWKIDGPFSGPPVHRHDSGVDSFYVIDGELAMTVEGDVVPAGAGTLASVPRGVLHTFAHPDGTGRFLNIHAPDNGFADFLRSLAD